MNTEPIVGEQQLPQPAPEQIPIDLEALRAKVSDLEQQASVFIREQPVAAVLAAVGVGFLVARLVSRIPR
jgi:hypothetical protein